MAPDHCIAHLKLLEAFHQLRENVGNIEDLFDIKGHGYPPPPFEEIETKKADIKQDKAALGEVRVREKRWAVYVARAADRFAKWWETSVPSSKTTSPNMLTTEELCTTKGIDKVAYSGNPIITLASADRLPPIGDSSKPDSHGYAC